MARNELMVGSLIKERLADISQKVEKIDGALARADEMEGVQAKVEKMNGTLAKIEKDIKGRKENNVVEKDRGAEKEV